MGMSLPFAIDLLCRANHRQFRIRSRSSRKNIQYLAKKFLKTSREPLPESASGDCSIMTNVADRLVQTLGAAGVSRIYGLVGDSLNGITDSLRGRGEIEWVHVRHEEVAA